ncbi:hypothetical protein FHS96_000922 [Sphingomonas zeicaulis]|uniref:hypothetical protein n=1 Tax=Sphingomonas zeicaulis TaxID=1632740 RepID=UPI003D1B723D
MSVRVVSGIIYLEGICAVEDAEPLLVALLDGCVQVDISSAVRLHMAIAQLLVAQRPTVIGTPADAFLARHIMPLIANADGAKQFRAAVDPL